MCLAVPPCHMPELPQLYSLRVAIGLFRILYSTGAVCVSDGIAGVCAVFKINAS